MNPEITVSDEVLSHLRHIAELPDLSGTRYELLEELGRGGMGVVYRARDTELRREVALKVLDHLDELEARTLASLEHPGIVPVHDSGELADGRVFYVMKLVRGLRLDEYRAASVPDLLRVFLKICEPVAFAHARGVIHRDLKPQNVMVGEFGEVLVLDWGIPGLGTPDYQPPEGSRDARSDVYALGKILEFLLAKQQSAPGSLRAICRKATATEASLRYDDAGGLARAIAAWLDGKRQMSRYQALAALVLAYLIMRAALFFWIRH